MLIPSLAVHDEQDIVEYQGSADVHITVDVMDSWDRTGTFKCQRFPWWDREILAPGHLPLIPGPGVDVPFEHPAYLFKAVPGDLVQGVLLGVPVGILEVDEQHRGYPDVDESSVVIEHVKFLTVMELIVIELVRFLPNILPHPRVRVLLVVDIQITVPHHIHHDGTRDLLFPFL